MSSKFAFRVNIENDSESGRIIAVYFQIRKGKSAKTTEHADGAVFADYDRAGNLLGVEMLGPCQAKVLGKIGKMQPEKKFIKDSVPRGMLVTA